MFEALEASGLLATIKVLDLSDSNLHAHHVEWLATHTATLDQLVIERTSITDASTLPNAVHSQREGSGPTYRYVVGQE